MLVQLVIKSPLQQPYDLRLPPARYKIRVNSIQHLTANPATGDLVELNSVLFRQTYGNAAYFTFIDDLTRHSHDKTSTWEAEILGPVSIGVNLLSGPPGVGLNFSRMVLYLDVERV